MCVFRRVSDGDGNVRSEELDLEIDAPFQDAHINSPECNLFNTLKIYISIARSRYTLLKHFILTSPSLLEPQNPINYLPFGVCI